MTAFATSLKLPESNPIFARRFAEYVSVPRSRVSFFAAPESASCKEMIDS